MKNLFLFCLIATFSTVSYGQKAIKVGGDRDAHGCIGSAGYTWSALQKQCIRLWEAGTAMRPTDHSSLVTYVIFSADQKQVEVFMPAVNPYIMNMTGQNNYTYNKYTLNTKDSLVLRENGKMIFSGKMSQMPAAIPSPSPAKGITIDTLGVAFQPGYVTFGKGGNTIFYYEAKAKKGRIKANGKEYAITNLKFNKDSYVLTGPGLLITAPKCKYNKNKGEDCFYGTCKLVTVKLGTALVKVSNVDVVDCPGY